MLFFSISQKKLFLSGTVISRSFEKFTLPVLHSSPGYLHVYTSIPALLSLRALVRRCGGNQS